MMQRTDYTIRPMRESDLDEVCALEAEIFSIPWKRRDFEQALQNKDTIYMTALRGRDVVGYCGLYRSFEEADIVNVAVARPARGLGIGEKMLRALMEEGKTQGIDRFTLEVRAGNAPAIHLYEKLGFRCEGYRKHFYSLPEEDAAIMWKREGDD